MRILLVHNYYQIPGGERRVFEEEGKMLEAFGHTVLRYTAHNDEVAGLNVFQMAGKTLWNRQALHALRSLIQQAQPDVVHVHNTLPLISPVVYYAAHEAGLPVVQTLHNYRLICPGVLLMREGKPCEKCLGKTFAWPGIVHGCYRESRATTAMVAGMVTAHRWAGTWTQKIDQYIALTQFARNKFIEGGLPADKITIKPNFVVEDPGIGEGGGGYALFVGRLSVEKGVHTLLKTWTQHQPDMPLYIVGDGPLAGDVQAAIQQQDRIQWLGQKTPDEVYALMGKATVTILPSECYETFGRVIVESFATGTPVIVSDIGAMAELVQDQETGLLFQAGHAQSLADQLQWIQEHTDRWQSMRSRVRIEYERHYTAKQNYKMLMEIYERVIGH